MAIEKPPALIAVAQLRVVVGRDGPGDLVEGVRRLLERAPGVEAAEDLDVRNVQPGLNDVRLDVDARLRVRPADRDSFADDDPNGDGDAAAMVAQLREGFGVRAVTVRRLERP